MSPALSIIVPVRDLPRYTRRCLAAVEAHTALPHEIIVVDNASARPTRNFLERWARGRSDLVLVRSRRNQTFAAAVNQGMLRARAPVLVWLNNDAVVTPQWAERLLRRLASSPRVAAVGPCSNDPACGLGLGRGHDPALGHLPLFAQAWSLRHDGQSQEVHELAGFCLALKKAAAARVGLLDERFLWGHEDNDYCYRLLHAGYRLLVAKDVFVYHYASRSRKRWRAGRRSFLMRRNRDLLIRKWLVGMRQIQDHVRADVETAPPSR